MFKTILAKNQKTAHERERSLLSLELAEIRDISEILFQRIQKKVQLLQALESTVDKKIIVLEQLVNRAEALRLPGAGVPRQHEIFRLAQRGMKSHDIADTLDMPVGEVELILELNTTRA